MLGVTIGINPIYKALSLLSSFCLKEMTGLDVVILDESHLLQYGLCHPAALKLMVFDIIKDDNILYFDADWFCIQEWEPRKLLNTTSINACHDFILDVDWPDQYTGYQLEDFDNYPFAQSSNPAIRNDYVSGVRKFCDLKLPCLNWINTGFWIANKNHHQAWLKEALKYYQSTKGHHPEYYEQPAMNRALESLNIQVNYLNRKYNTLVASRNTWPEYLIGLHVKANRHPDFIAKVINGKITSTAQVKDHFII
jgi:hypothetical protein